jgi:hypothetical protein
VVATDGVNWPQRRAEAMTRLAGAWLRDQRPPKPLTDQVEVLIHVNANAATSDRRIAAEDTCRLDSGEFLAPSVVWRLACDARVRTVIEDGAGNVLDIGRRTLPTRLKFPLRARDRGCRFPGCTSRQVEGHHVEHWADGGATRLDNLVSLCAHHHNSLQRVEFRVVEGDGNFRFISPTNREIKPACYPQFVQADPRAIESEHRAVGPTIGAHTVAGRSEDVWDCGLALAGLVGMGSEDGLCADGRHHLDGTA